MEDTNETVENIKAAFAGALLDKRNILQKRSISPTKQPNSKRATIYREILFDAFNKAITENEMGTYLNTYCLAVIKNLTKRVKMVEAINSEECIKKRDQEMAEVKNCLGHQNEETAPLPIQEQLLAIDV